MQKIKCVFGTYSYGKRVYKAGSTYLVDQAVAGYLCAQSTPEGRRYFELVIDELPAVSAPPVTTGRGRTKNIDRKKKGGKVAAKKVGKKTASKKAGGKPEVSEPPLDLSKTPAGQLDKDWNEGGADEANAGDNEVLEV